MIDYSMHHLLARNMRIPDKKNKYIKLFYALCLCFIMISTPSTQKEDIETNRVYRQKVKISQSGKTGKWPSRDSCASD